MPKPIRINKAYYLQTTILWSDIIFLGIESKLLFALLGEQVFCLHIDSLLGISSSLMLLLCIKKNHSYDLLVRVYCDQIRASYTKWVLNTFRLVFENLNLIWEVIGKFSVTWSTLTLSIEIWLFSILVGKNLQH